LEAAQSHPLFFPHAPHFCLKFDICNIFPFVQKKIK
jgi:hypothetical protein